MEEDNDLTLEDIFFREKSLANWEFDLTVNIPPLPTTSLNIQNVISLLNNQYQIAYNCYNELMVLYSRSSRNYKALLDTSIKMKINSYVNEGVKKYPGRETLEAICFEENENIRIAFEEKSMIGIIRDFFENNKNKLEKSMQLALNVSFGVCQSDKMYFKSGDPRS